MMATSIYPARSSLSFSLTRSQIPSISVYYASGHADRGSLNEGQHRRVSIHPGLMNSADLLRAEAVGVYPSATSGKEKMPGWDEKTPEEEGVHIGQDTTAELESGRPKAGKRGGRMLVTGKVLLRTAMSNTDRCGSICFRRCSRWVAKSCERLFGRECKLTGAGISAMKNIPP